ncbi:diaminopropionate ammonia-lyase [Lacibacterium aquatile]|uniref:Diaminopropionate ammonia-lyase n=1 Tax=Lacibacterium aquatile TaxID=1168082 RepID=A0ABW5DUP3_9PROT
MTASSATSTDPSTFFVATTPDPHAAKQVADALLSPAAVGRATEVIRSTISPAPTPLISLPALARQLGIGALHFKDEGQRAPLKSFKMIGGAFAVAEVLADLVEAATGTRPSATALAEGHFKHLTGQAVMTCATDGNHGRAVSWAAQRFGAKAVIYVGEAVSPGRVAAMEAWGSEVRRVKGVYEDAVAAAAAQGAAGWHVISDTAYPGCEAVPRLVMQGYAVLADEIIAAVPEVPTHVLLQCGVGGMAGAVTARIRQVWGMAPRIIVCEPERADCAFQSARAGSMTPASGDLDTLCAGLACGELSTTAWEILSVSANGFLTFTEAEALAAMKRLNRPLADDPSIVAGECAGAGLAGLAKISNNFNLRSSLALDESARAVIIGTEGDTDPTVHRQLLETPL